MKTGRSDIEIPDTGEPEATPAWGLAGCLGESDIRIPHTQEWELYHNSFSLCSKKLRVCLAELEIPYRSHHIDLIETGHYENVGRAYLKINPRGLLPVLVHKGRPIYESHDEIVYAAAQAGKRGRELLPKQPETRAVVDQWMDCASLKGDNPVQGSHERAGHCVPGLTLPLFATMVRTIPYREIAKGLLTHPNKERPMVFLALKTLGIHGLAGVTPFMKLIRRSRDDMGHHLDALGKQWERHGQAWITGERFTLADVSWVVILDRLAEADWDEYFWGEGRRPAVSAYWKRLRERPSYGPAIDESRGDSVRRGMVQLKLAKAQNRKLRESLGVARGRTAKS